MSSLFTSLAGAVLGPTLAAALVAGCGGSPTAPAATDAPAAPHVGDAPIAAPAADAGGAIAVTRDVAYHTDADGRTVFLDVVAPVDATGLPVVVLFHPNPAFSATKESERRLASMIAERGALVVVPTYGVNRFDPPAIMRLSAQHGSCAVWAAAEWAAAAGADLDRLVVVGDVTGVVPAQFVVFDPMDEVEGCASAPVPVTIDQAILFEVDWLLVPDLWDPYLRDDVGFFAEVTHWDDIGVPSRTRLHYVAGEMTEANTERALEAGGYEATDWVRLRDPDLELAEAWERAGTLADGEMSFTDVARLVTELLVDAGWDADFRLLPGVGHSLSNTAARQAIVDLVFEG